MIGNLPHLDGSTVDWAQYSGLRIGSVALWVAVTVLVILAVKKLSLTKVADAAGTVSGLISLVLLVTLVTLGFTKQGLEHKFSMINTTFVRDSFFTASITRTVTATPRATEPIRNPESCAQIHHCSFIQVRQIAYP